MKKELILLTFILCSIRISAQTHGWVIVGDTGSNALNANGYISCLRSDQNGNIYACGNFTNASGKYYVAKWDGQSWTELGSGSNALNANNNIVALAADKSGNVYAAGIYTDASDNSYIARWDGNSWHYMTGIQAMQGPTTIKDIAVDAADKFYACADTMIDMITWFSRGFLEKWDGVNWELAPYTGSHPNLTCAYLWGPLKLAPDAFGNMYAISDTDYSWNPCNFNSSNVIKWNGTEWTQLGTGCNVLGAYGQLADLCTDPAGNVYAAGTIKNSLNHLYIAKWNGSAWGELGNDPLFFTSSDFTSLCSDASGNIYASGPWDELNHLYVAKFNGTTWEKLSFRDFQNGSIGTICTDPGGTLYAAGDFSNYYNGKDVYNVAKYVGLTGIKEERNIPVVDVCPNPADEDVTIRVEKYLPGSVYLLIDSFGRTVRTGVLSGLVSVIDLKSLATGLYFFSLVNQPGSTVKLVKR